MKKQFALAALVFGIAVAAIHAQPGMRGPMGGPPPAPRISGYIKKIFGDHPAFLANTEMQTSGSDNMSVSGNMSYLDGKSRFEMNMADMKSSRTQPGVAEHMKQMGMDRMVIISRPDKKITYTIYPGMNAYVEQPLRDPEAAKSEADSKMETTELGKESVDGHACVKNKVVITDKDGKTHESTVWNATDLNKFPVKVQTTDQGVAVTMLFKNVKLEKPAENQFEPPADAHRYNGMAEMMREEMMRRMGGAGAMGQPPGQ